jgi:hypothetical protein
MLRVRDLFYLKARLGVVGVSWKLGAVAAAFQGKHARECGDGRASEEEIEREIERACESPPKRARVFAAPIPVAPPLPTPSLPDCEKLLLTMVNSMFNTPARVDALAGEWFNNRSSVGDLGGRMTRFMELLFLTPISMSVTNDSIVKIFDCPQFSIHLTALDRNETSILKHVVRYWRQFFDERLNLVSGGAAPHVCYRRCKFDAALQRAISPARICARALALMLYEQRGGGRVGRVPGVFFTARLVLGQCVDNFRLRHPALREELALAGDVLAYGSAVIVDRTWDPARLFLPLPDGD